MKLTISRLDYKNPTEINGYYPLPQLNNINDITDVNEVKSIFAYFTTKEKAESFHSKFPKSYKARLGNISGMTGYNFYVGFTFNTFWGNKTTGDVNETAQKLRDKVISKIKSFS
jgi:hypothetical protein